MPRYVILRHEGSATYKPGVHWDLLLELDDSLRAWTLADEPTAPGPIAAAKLPDHRLEYLDYEGPIAGDRGTVSRWDAGEFTVDSETPTELIFSFLGGHMRGLATLFRGSEDYVGWLFRFEPEARA